MFAALNRYLPTMNVSSLLVSFIGKYDPEELVIVSYNGNLYAPKDGLTKTILEEYNQAANAVESCWAASRAAPLIALYSTPLFEINRYNIALAALTMFGLRKVSKWVETKAQVEVDRSIEKIRSLSKDQFHFMGKHLNFNGKQTSTRVDITKPDWEWT